MKPRLSFWQIVHMNVGFFGIQFSFGLQQANMSPIYQYLGAEESKLPFLWLAGPITGLLVQPIVGAMSDRCTSRFGRRTPFFLIGALMCSLGLLAMPLSPTLWFAAGLLWLLDAANNVTMEPYRAYVSDRLNDEQLSQGFLTQSAFTGLAQTCAYLTPSLLVWLGMSKVATAGNDIPQITAAAFSIGAALSITTVAWSVYRVPELPLSEPQRLAMTAKARGALATLVEIWQAIRQMPPTMRQLVGMSFFQWYAMSTYWIYIVPALASTVFDEASAGEVGFVDASLLNGQLGGFYNFVAFLSALAMAPLTRKHGAKSVHALCLVAGAVGMCAIPLIQSKALLFVPMIGIGLCWASIMGNPYVLVAKSIPPERAGVYMGIFNLFIVVPMLLQMLSLPLIYNRFFGGEPQQAITLAGLGLFLAAICMAFVKPARPTPSATHRLN